MEAVKNVVTTYNIKISEEERKGLVESIKAVNDGEGSIDEYGVLINFVNLLKTIAD
ncbi:MAG TPA: hypothetical protein VK190_02520 [Pseudoneobacillus sp.]|nr:hypothetical protein [Pseudoneobacillus sp.]